MECIGLQGYPLPNRLASPPTPDPVPPLASLVRLRSWEGTFVFLQVRLSVIVSMYFPWFVV